MGGKKNDHLFLDSLRNLCQKMAGANFPTHLYPAGGIGALRPLTAWLSGR
jgi:hypothetical protein